MIYVDIKGNLGNQLFEYACARQIQEITGDTICLNTVFLNKYRPDMTFSLNNYKLNDKVFVESEKTMPWYVNTYAGMTRILKGIMPNLYYNFLKKFNVYVWMRTEYKYIPIKENKKGNIYLAGYWQCDKYFNSIRDIIIEEFKPKEDRRYCNSNLYDIIENTESICVTIRRGDYVTNIKTNSHHYVCGPDFFINGVNEIRKKIPEATVCVFSDDINWVKENINFGDNVYYENGNDPVWEKLRLMSLCKHFVISNSSFSWWAQYLSTNDNKIVYAPTRWYADGTEADIYCENWQYINV